MHYNTLTKILELRSGLGNSGITFIERSDQEDFLSYKDLYYYALRGLAYLQNKGIQPKDELVFQIEDNRTFIVVYWACVLGGIIPVPLTLGQNDDHKQKLFNIWPILNNPYLIISEEGLNKLEVFAKQKGFRKTYSEFYQSKVDLGGIMSSPTEGQIYESQEDDIAFIQFSSGSTGSPKGVVLTHKNLITNMAAISAASEYSIKDSMLSWMPLTHDMGLIGFHLNPLFIGMHQYLMPTNLFVRRPALWLDKASKHKVTILCSPNFGYKYVIKHCNTSESYDWDLSSIRIIYNGAEPISEQLSQEFLNSLSKFGLKRNAMCPVYGLAEASLAVSISNLDEEVISYDFDRDKLNFGEHVSVTTCSENSVSFVNVGKAINDCSIRITDDNNVVVDSEVIGHVQIKGDNVTSCYYNNEEATKNAISEDNWLKTGDLGFIKEGALYITGRIKDIIFVNGQNFYPHDIERIAEDIEGIELNKIAVVGYFNESQKEEIIAFVFHRGNLEKFIPVLKALKAHININVGFEMDRVIPVKDIPRTTSGKLQRFKLLQQFKAGDFEDIESELNYLLQKFESTDIIVEPANEREFKLVEIWKEILAVDNIGVTQSFFEIGGNSLKAAEMIMAFSKEFQVEVSLDVLYKKQTIRGLSDAITTLERCEYIPIPAVLKQVTYSLSSSQKRLYYAWQMDKGSIGYNTPIAFDIKGKVDKEKLERCIRMMAQRHDSLRMTFEMTSEPKFRIADHINFNLDSVVCGANEVSKKLKSLVLPFDLDNGPLFKAALLNIEDDKLILFLDFHHIISDGISIYNFIDELSKLYDERELSASIIGYKDFVSWETENLQSSKLVSQKEFWFRQLKGELPILEMPTDNPRPLIFNYEGEKIEFELGVEATTRLKELANDNNCTLHVLMYTLYCTLLSKYTGQHEVIVGIPVAGRGHADLQKMQGMFVNNLAIRSEIKGDELFNELLQIQKANLSEALNNQEYPFESLVNEINERRDVSRNPVFDTMFVYQNMGFPQAKNSGFSLTRRFFDPGFSKFDISMEVFDYEQSIKYSIEYSTMLFEKESILRLQKYFDLLVNAVIRNPQATIYDLSMLSDSEHDWYINTYNSTESNYPKDKVIHQLFEEQAKANPDAIAVEFNGKNLTYEQLNNQADCLAMLLREKGIKTDHAVGVMLPRSPELIIAILAVLKAGGSYLPLDTELPEERINYILTHSQCNVVVTATGYETQLLNWQLKATDLQPVILNLDKQDLTSIGKRKVKNVNDPNDLAYIIYTSGTTGKPKGVMIEHHSLVNYISWAADKYVLGEQATFPLYTSISFDLTITSIFTPLITGNKIVVYQEDGNELLITKIVTDNKVNVVKLTPSHLKLIKESKVELPGRCSIKRFIVGGEELEQKLANDIYEKFGKNIEIFNEYGPTEATVGCMIHNFEPTETSNTVPIGIPANNTQIYILDRFLKPVPTSVKGEIYISGDGLARGYLFNDDLTDERFVPNPFIEGQKMYKTGDVAKRLVNGNIEFIGRADQQVKINGYRIELAEIENCLTDHSSVSRALITAKVNQKDKKVLNAYFVADSDQNIEVAELRNYLAARLPHYMIPASFIQIQHVPLTKNGKVDYQALPESDTIKEQKEIVSPKSDFEKISLKIWSEIFGADELSVTDNFYELGGDSIKAVQISSRLNEEGISLKVKDILTYHTIEQTCLHAEIVGENMYEQGLIKGKRGLTPIEAWFFSQNHKNANYYNQSVLLDLNEKVNMIHLQKAFGRIIKHHDGLRLNIDVDDRTLVYNNENLSLSFVIPEYNVLDSEELLKICEQIKAEIKLDEGSIMKAGLIRMKDHSEKLFITVHHLAVDGISWRILLEDLYRCYTAIEKGQDVKLPAKTASLIDWHDHLMKYAISDEVKESKKYWSNEGIEFSIPQDFEADDWSCKNLKNETGVFDEQKTEFLLKEAHSAYQTDVPILLNVALILALKNWTGLDAFMIEHENHGRHLSEVDTSRTVGWFTAMYPVRLEVTEDALDNQIKAVKEQMRAIPSHGMGYGVSKYLNIAAIAEAPSITEIRFNYLGQFDREMNNSLFSFSKDKHGKETDAENTLTAKMEINIMVVGGELMMDINYNSHAHSRATMRWFIDTYFKNLENVLEHIGLQSDVHFSPSDFDDTELTEEDLDVLFS